MAQHRGSKQFNLILSHEQRGRLIVYNHLLKVMDCCTQILKRHEFQFRDRIGVSVFVAE